MTRVGIHIFRRDLRIYDNVALHLLSKEVDKIIPIFIFDPFQIDNTAENKSYRSDPAVKNMIESLDDLDKDLRKNGSKLFYFYDDPSQILDKLIKSVKPIMISYNADYSKYSLKRDKDMDNVCKHNKIELIKFMDDLTINKMEDFLNKDKVFKVFGAFFKHGQKVKPRKEVGKPNNFISSSTSISGQFNGSINKFYDKDTNISIKGGRTEALKILRKMKGFHGYSTHRDNLTYKTTYLSGYLKFGCISIVECFNTIKASHNADLIKQMFWRQYFFILSRFHHTGYDHVDEFFSKIKWKNNITEAKALWDDANTGFPVVDAAVRQLQEEGYMHNRGRLIVSSFAVKILHQDPHEWKLYGGQHVFSSMLFDCCYANNYGNWNFTVGPYDLGGFRFGKAGTKGGRMINPTDYKKWDPKLEYVRKYIPELKDVPDKDVFKWDTKWENYPDVKYPGPIVDFKERKDEWYKLTKK